MATLSPVCVCVYGMFRWRRNLLRKLHVFEFPPSKVGCLYAKKMSETNPWNVVFVLGPPGCGKGTQCTKLNQTYGFVHLSAGDLLREERMREGSQFGKLIEGHMKNGTIVPVEITCKLLENAMISVGHPPGFLIDGFPRNRDNLDGWDREMGKKTKLLFVLFLECPEEVCVARCLGRGQGRIDDNEESLKKRYQNYLIDTMPIIKYFQEQKSVRTIETSKNADQVFSDIKRLFDEIR